MSDIIDQANDTADVHLRASLSQLRTEDIPEPCGVCLNCEALLATGLRWCDSSCRRDWFRNIGRLNDA